ncbi:GGDEF domain-containing protein [Achromobacter kerstersii]|uniref:GGDEF domain-containing protein n=1 Tax=Achromobacter kerstersii TaxID=1353890 RepID=UPI00313D7B05
MHVDLFTLYLLVIGTLLASAGMTYWEHRTHSTRSKALGMFAAGFATLAAGCTVVLLRGYLPASIGPGLSNLIILSGYLLVLHGVASFNGRQYRAASIGLLIVMAVLWAVAGAQWRGVMWAYVSAAPIAAIAAMTAWEMWRCAPMKALSSRYFVIVVTVIHALFYAFRAFILPWLVATYGPDAQVMASNITMYEGVLYSVLLPMALLKLVREEAHGQLLHESQTDYLTRLGNRRWFFEEGARLIRDSAGRAPIAVLAFDLDHFKSINDRHGHETGDKVLRAFADIAQRVVGPGVMLARLGGEEFAALLTGDPARRAQALGETMAAHFAATLADHIQRGDVQATVSIGLARFEQDAPPLREALAAADRALYRAKSLGGNRLELA